MTRPGILARWNEWRKQPVVLYGIHHTAVFMTIFIALGHLFYYGPGELERFMATQIMSGKVPYIDFRSEYPPLSFVGFVLPALLFKEQPGYSFAFAFELLVADLVILVIIASLARRMKQSVWNVLLVYTIFILAVGPIAVTRYDLLPTMLAIAGMYAFVSHRSNIAWGLIALGTAAKLYPVLFVPLFAIHHLRQRQYGSLVAGSALYLVVILVTVSPWLILNAGSLLSLVGYHAQRGLHAESTYGTVLLFVQIFQATRLQGALTFGSWNIISPVADRLAGYSPYITAGALLVTYAFYWWRLRSRRASGARADFDSQSTHLMVVFSSLVVMVFMLGNKVFSAQYLIWACPLLALVGGRWRIPIVVLFVVAAALTQYIFPYRYREFEMFQPYLVIMAFARNVILVGVVAYLVLSLRATNKRHVR